MQFSDKRIQAVIVVLFFLFLTLVSWKIPGHGGDVSCWAAWATYTMQHGLHNAYGSGTDYTPLYQYVVWLFGIIQGNEEDIRHYIGFIRVFTLLADFLGIYLVYRWIGKSWDFATILLISMLNLAYSYDTIMWAQCDGILATFAFAAFYFLYRGRMMLSGAMLVLMLNMKLQGIVLIPLWGLLCIEYFARTRRWRDIPLTLLSIILTQALIVLPFAFGEGGVALVWKKTCALVGAAPYVSMNAFNLWYLLYPDIDGKYDTLPFIGGLSFNQAGLLLFCASSFVAFLPLLQVTVKQIFRRGKPEQPKPSPELIWLTAAMLMMLFFYFNTQMHERYTHPAFIFLAAFAFATRRVGLYILFSITTFLSLERVLHSLELRNYDTVLFGTSTVAVLFAGCIVWMGLLLFRVQRLERDTAIRNE